jgi:uncharacterized DUF497 family protein
VTSEVRGESCENPASRNEAGGLDSCKSTLAISLVSRYYLDMLQFHWDERKNRGNRKKHGVWFEEAESVFQDPHARLFYDPEHSEEEERFLLLGVSSAERTLVVVHCYGESDALIRIISARKATRKEVRFYEEGI